MPIGRCVVNRHPSYEGTAMSKHTHIGSKSLRMQISNLTFVEYVCNTIISLFPFSIFLEFLMEFGKKSIIEFRHHSIALRLFNFYF